MGQKRRSIQIPRSQMARLVLFGAVLGAADAFQALAGLRGTASLSKIAMQVAAEPVAQQAALAKAADEARGLAIDSISKAESGHMGLPLGCAEIGAILYGQEMVYNPADPAWINRDRFVLSAGHGSMFLYSWLHMAGFDLSVEEVANFRAKDSKTPGHPEFGWTPGVESTTGPLGQGIGNGVGLAAAGKLAAATLNTPEHTIIDHHVVVLCGPSRRAQERGALLSRRLLVKRRDVPDQARSNGDPSVAL